MIKQLLTRRQFFKTSLFGAAVIAGLPAIGLAAVAVAPSREAQAAAARPQQPHAPDLPQPTFTQINSDTTFGSLTDISMGWDGTLWGIDAQGAPHIYDELNNVWEPHGDGIDAAMQDGDLLYFFKDNMFVTASQQALLQTSAPQTIASKWPTLPDSFKTKVVGAANWDGTRLILFNGGRYVSTDGSIPATTLTSLTGWPTSDIWADGVIDAVYATPLNTPIVLLRGNQYLAIDPVAKKVTTPPTPLSATYLFSHYLPADWVSEGFDAMTVAGIYSITFKGNSVVIYNNAYSDINPPNYIPSRFKGWPLQWHPVLQHAPSGRDGNLWSVLPQSLGGWVLQHNGEAWTQLPNQADHAGVGQDNSIMIASAGKLWTVKANSSNTGFDVNPVSQANNLIQVSLGNANAVFARDSSNNVYRFDPTAGSLTPNTAVGAVAHIATTNDGTLWHAKQPADGNLYRFLNSTNAVQAGIPVKAGIVSTVNKVAATGFGAAHCLTQQNGQTQAYRYDSPYIFKTSAAYTSSSSNVSQGLGRLYITDVQINILQASQVQWIVAIDAHTGQELSRSAPLAQPEPTYGTPTFDPVNDLVYVGTQKNYEPTDPYDRTTPGTILALDARDLTKVVWSFTTAALIDAAPVVNGTTLLFGDRSGALYAFDTRATAASPAQPQPKWVWQIGTHIDSTAVYNIAPPLVSNGQMTAAVWTIGTWANPSYVLWSAVCQVADGTDQTTKQLYTPTATSSLRENQSLLTTPVMVKKVSPDLSQPSVNSVFFNGGDAIITVNPVSGQAKFNLQTGAVVNAGLTLDPIKNLVWFVTNSGLLYGLDIDFKATGPFTVIDNNPYAAVFASPIAYTDSQGNSTIVLGVYDESARAGGLYGFDPVSGNSAYLATGATQILSLSAGATNGVIYAAGTDEDTVSQATFGQVWGIRIDPLTKGQRDFIIESQLMQDPQDPGGTSGAAVIAPDKNIIPPSVARYQTHLTVVNDQKLPQPNEPIKIWAEIAGTMITVNGTTYTVGPDDASFATAKTGIDGSLVIVSDAKDVNTPALRVWASFMNPYERILVYPDHEWHGRSTNSYSDATADPTKPPDPTKPNLNTVYSYKPDTTVAGSTTPKPLFTSDEKSQGTPTHVANAISQMKSGLTPGGNNPATLAGALKTVHASTTAAPYVAYADLGGMHYGPNNARAKRTATITAPFGFVLNMPKGTNQHTFTPLSHSEARNQIDGLTGDAWDPNNPNAPLLASATAHANGKQPVRFGVRRVEDFFSDFWNWLVGAINTVVQAVENVIVSVAEDIMVGISFVINGVTKVFKAIIKVIEDVVNAIGSFFVQLAKLIEEVIEALSILFQFGEIMWTHQWLEGQVDGLLTELQDTISNTIISKIDTFFSMDKCAVQAFFATLKSDFSTQGNPPLNKTKGYGQTPHSAFTVTPKGGTPSSQATQCSWGTEKAKSGMPSATATNGSLQRTSASAPSGVTATGDPVADFFTTFIGKLSSDPTLSAATTQLKSDFGNLIQVNSVEQFFSQLMVALLDVIETLVLSALVVANALVDGLAAIISDLVSTVKTILNTQIQIPVLTWLYNELIGEPLTFLSVITLVSAIPITLLFRLIQGEFPQYAGLPTNPTAATAAATPAGATPVGAMQISNAEVAPKPALMAFGIFVSICQIVQGIAFGFGDAVGEGDSPPAASYAALASGTLIELFTFPLIGNAMSDVTDADWVVYGVGVFATFSLAASVPYTPTDGEPNEPLTALEGSLLTLFFGLASLAAGIWAYVQDGKTDGITNTGFAETVIGSFVSVLNPVKLNGAEAAGIIAGVDMVSGIVLFFMTLFTSIISNSSPAPRTHRLYAPWVAANPEEVVRAASQPMQWTPALISQAPGLDTKSAGLAPSVQINSNCTPTLRES